MTDIDKLNIKTKSCIRNDRRQVDLDKSINIYVVMTNKCNAACEFCEFRGNRNEVDTEQFKEALDIVMKYYNIGTVHFTGGEPTLELDKIKQLCDIIKATDKSIKTSVNTNGLHLMELAEIESLDNVALSRHALTDSENYDIFKTNSVASEKEIEAFPKSKLHLSCNLIQGYIDSEDKIYQYLEKYSALGVFDVGFVGLMKINDYCRTRYVEFPDLKQCTFTRSFRNINNNNATCECKNWLYRTSKCNLVSIYHRHVLGNTDTINYIVYKNNKLFTGFNGEEIVI